MEGWCERLVKVALVAKQMNCRSLSMDSFLRRCSVEMPGLLMLVEGVDTRVGSAGRWPFVKVYLRCKIPLRGLNACLLARVWAGEG